MSDAHESHGAEAPTSAKAWREANHKLVVLPSGRAIRIRKLTAEFALVIRDTFEKYLSASDQATKGAIRPQAIQFPLAEQRKYLRVLLQEAVVVPRVVPDHEATTDDTMHLSDFGPDLDPLVAAIHEWNGEVLRLAEPFPATEAGDAAPRGGEDLWSPAVGPAEAGSA